MASANTWLKIQEIKIEKEGYSNRRDQVQGIKNSVSNVSDDYVSTINRKIDSLNSSLTSGIKGLSVVATFTSEISKKKEKSGTSDAKLNEYDGELSSEISDCNRKIESLDGEIAQLQSKYNREVEAEREAARKAAEELAKKAKDILTI